MSQTLRNVEDQIQDLYKDIENKRNEILKLRRDLPEEPVADFELKDVNGKPVMLSDLFGDNDELLIVHNMGKACVFCTMWADGINGMKDHMENRVPFVVVSPDDPVTQKKFAESRDWQFKMVSSHDSSFIRDMGFKNDTGHYYPGASALIKKDDGSMFRVGKDFFGPGDFYNPAWHFFDLFPKGYNDWGPKYKY